jgi:hypothetical protein
MTWKDLSKEFPGISIGQNTETHDFRVVFDNLEPHTRRHYYIFMAVLAALVALMILGFGYLPDSWGRVGVAALWAGIIWSLGGAFVLERPWKTRRGIQLDMQARKFRVWRNGKVTCERPIESFKNLSVDDHPDLDLERQERHRKRREGPGPIEKQHCLIGWFGPEGTQRVDLIDRFEWPKRYSLQDVAGAVNFVIKHMADQVEAARPVQREAEGEPARRTGINPPLD